MQKILFFFIVVCQGCIYCKDPVSLNKRENRNFSLSKLHELSYRSKADSTSLLDDEIAALDRIVLSRKASLRDRTAAYNRLEETLQTLPYNNVYRIQFPLPLIRPDSPLRYVALNPSIQKTEEGYTVLCRVSSFKQERGYNYGRIDPLATQVQNKNFLLQYAKNMSLISYKEILDDCPRERGEKAYAIGPEDCRLIQKLHHSDPWAMICTICDVGPQYLPQMAYGELSEDNQIVHFKRCVLLTTPYSKIKRKEKNWMPFFKDQKLHVIYTYDPFLIYSVDTITGRCIPVTCYTPKNNFLKFRGSASPIPFENGYLLLIHEAISQKDHRIYVHRFIYLNEAFMITKVSRMFSFMHTGIEFSCGMTTDHTNKNLLIGVGFEDKAAYIVSVNLEVVRSMLKPVL